MVGAVIVENEEIIGEGWHQCYGQAHAEINALRSVKDVDRHRIPKSTIYVSLEPCSIHGNTPPCTDAILREGIKKVVIASRDKTIGVDHVSEYILTKKGVDVNYNEDDPIGAYIASARNTYVSKNRPHIILKWAQSRNGLISLKNSRTPISTPFARRYVHQLRSRVDAILVGSNTVQIDNPRYLHFLLITTVYIATVLLSPLPFT